MILLASLGVMMVLLGALLGRGEARLGTLGGLWGAVLEGHLAQTTIFHNPRFGKVDYLFHRFLCGRNNLLLLEECLECFLYPALGLCLLLWDEFLGRVVLECLRRGGMSERR